ncbi:MAG: hypothetical protein L3J91_04035 [Thermoplasmata archaeon]|nr:hypothetical protein [Thermoplasmata archaeon]
MGSFAIWGTARSDLLRLAWSVAEAVDPAFIWIDVTEGGAAPSSRELEVLEEISLDRIGRMDRGDLLVRNGNGADRSSEPTSASAPSAGHWMPSRLRERIPKRPDGVPTSLVLANLDRSLPLADDGGAVLLDRLVAGAREDRLSLIATFGVDPAPPLSPFECLIHVTPGPGGNIWNPTVDWTSLSPGPIESIQPPPAGTSHRDAVRHIRGHRRGTD